MTDDPHLRILGFSLWIDGRQFPDAADYWDGNWLNVRAHMKANGADVRCDGPILMTTDISQLRNQLFEMSKTLKGKAALTPLEPELKITFEIKSRGVVEAIVEITPDHMTQHHHFVLDIDQSYLPELINACDDILARFPVTNIDSND